ncbi:MarR family winged helix-turn-helix transcriptional regulator [Methylogaea oryzae]|uniref:Transcriptional regulator n=1 Tax=Methylogaea oryzae TaxID=1295382 RepID=A0A8D5AK84_9GAMM|nr:MarR family winged helix-turn-helix transcriptional regulator [Methylogaea oryzae]BBL71534.1 transcriptional regulator [Methylogaea oryzae]
MDAASIYEYLERISHLLRADARRTDSGAGLQPVQLEALHYLSLCNQYSNTPAAVADYLGLTKGTVSQTLQVLESNGYVEKQPDAKDRRVVHLLLTEEGRELVASAIPPKTLRGGIDSLSENARQQLGATLRFLLEAMQRENRRRPFGVCRTCRHNTDLGGDSFRCELTGGTLTAVDVTRICREHQPGHIRPSL